MAAAAFTTAAEPDGAPRLPALDVLRGIAILGILFMNISGMGGSLYAVLITDPRRFGWGAADRTAWWLREVLAEGTARCLLEMLFGVGMVILTTRAAARLGGVQVLRGYAWRNIVLFGFGLAHLFLLLWPGDILHTYAVAALVAVLFRALRPRLLLTVGLSLATLQLVGIGAAAIDAHQQRAAVARIEAKAAAGQPIAPAERRTLAAETRARAAQAQDAAAMRARAAADDRARTGTALSWVTALWGANHYLATSGLELAFIWEAASTMLIGAALFKLGVIQGARGRGFYRGLTAVAYLLGLALRIWAARDATLGGDGPHLSEAFGEYARLLTTLGHVGLVNLLLTGATGRRLLAPFAAAGRTALSLYILQTLVCQWLIYPPWGLALYGRQGWAALMATALAVDAALLALAVWWTRRFAIAPVEWAWRSIVAGRRLGWRSPPARGRG